MKPHVTSITLGFGRTAGTMFNLCAMLVLSRCLIMVTHAQVVFSTGDTYHLVGEYSLSYFRSNVDVSVFIGSTGSNYWDFSQPQGANDVVARMDVVSVSDGGHGGAFTGSAFAQRYQGGAISGTSWEYYSLDATNGLVFYGTYDPVGYGADPSIPITPPTSTLPTSVHFGDSWSNAYEFSVSDPLVGVIPVSYTSTSTVDAYGTVALPGIGAIPALRVMEVEDYEENIFGLTYPQLDTNWIWLSPGIGITAQGTSFGPDTYSLSAQTFTNSFSRVFLYPPLAPSPNARLMLQSNVAALTWSSTSNASGYVVQTCTNLSLAQWSPVAQLSNRYLSVPTIPGASQQFYKVIAQP